MQLVVDVREDYHQKMIELSLKRSAQLGRRVSMGFVLEELLDKEEKLEKMAQGGDPAPELFAAQD